MGPAKARVVLSETCSKFVGSKFVACSHAMFTHDLIVLLALQKRRERLQRKKALEMLAQVMRTTANDSSNVQNSSESTLL